jgi:hypothetical protein
VAFQTNNLTKLGLNFSIHRQTNCSVHWNAN